jgi:NTE family protein
VVASASIPGIFPPVARGKKLLVDGYVLANIPAPELRQQGADFIISVGLVEKPNTNYQNGVDLIYYVESIKQKQLDKWAIAESDFHINIDMSKFDATHFENYEVAIKHGYDTAKKSMPLLVKKLEKINV